MSKFGPVKLQMIKYVNPTLISQAMPKISTEPAGGSRETAETAVGLFGQIQQDETQEKGLSHDTFTRDVE